MEYDKREPKTEGDESGYSEEQNDLDIEIHAGEWQNLKRFKTYQKRTRQGKIIATYQAVSNRLTQLVKIYYSFVAKNPQEAAKMLRELQRLRLAQDILMNCLVWSEENQSGLAEQGHASHGTVKEQDEERLKDMIPQEIWDLIE